MSALETLANLKSKQVKFEVKSRWFKDENQKLGIDNEDGG